MYKQSFTIEVTEDGVAEVRGLTEEPIKLQPGQQIALEMEVTLGLKDVAGQ